MINLLKRVAKPRPKPLFGARLYPAQPKKLIPKRHVFLGRYGPKIEFLLARTPIILLHLLK